MAVPAPSRCRYLIPDERPVVEVRRHPFVLLRAGGQTVAAVAAASAVGALTSWDRGTDLIDTLVGLVAIFFVGRLLWKVVVWWEDKILVTDQRLFEVSGVFSRKVASMPLEKFTDVTYSRSVAGRIFGYGEFIVESAGQAQALERIDFVPQPDEFYRMVTSLVTTGVEPGRVLLDEGPPSPDEDDTGPLPRIIL